MEGDCTSLRFSFAFSGHFECYRDLSSARESLLPIYLLSMRDNASIQVKNATRDIQFIWRGFDGDDCFADFQIVATTEDGTEEFDFGPCVVWGLRELAGCFVAAPGRLQVSDSETPRSDAAMSFGWQTVTASRFNSMKAGFLASSCSKNPPCISRTNFSRNTMSDIASGC